MQKIYIYRNRHIWAESFDDYTVINNKGYSNPTAKCINCVRRVVHGLTYNLTEILPETVLSNLKNNLHLLIKARKPQIYLSEITLILLNYYEFKEEQYDHLTDDQKSGLKICGYSYRNNAKMIEINEINNLFQGKASELLNSYKERAKEVQHKKESRENFDI